VLGALRLGLHLLLYPQHQEREPRRGVFLIGEGPALPGAVHRTCRVAASLVGLRGDRLHHLAEAGIGADEGEAAEHVCHVQDIVPDERVLELAEIGADAEHKEAPVVLAFHLPEAEEMG
jgi:hypothetical protein